jgi:hypothetical protein
MRRKLQSQWSTETFLSSVKPVVIPGTPAFEVIGDRLSVDGLDTARVSLVASVPNVTQEAFPLVRFKLTKEPRGYLASTLFVVGFASANRIP